MEIESARVGLASQSRRQYTEMSHTRLHIRLEEPARPAPKDEVALSEKARALAPERRTADPEQRAGPEDELRMAVLRRFIEELTGRPLELLDVEAFAERLQEAATGNGVPAPASDGGDAPSSGPAWRLEYDHYEARVEHQSLRFTARAEVTTGDGQRLDIDLALNLSSTFVEERRVSLRAGEGALTDPLVVNLDVPAASLGERNLEFDLDSDGARERIAFVEPGSGLLALDRNDNGRVDDGSELFGPRTGAGFEELAAHDRDGDGFIDAGDPIHDRLRIWTRDGAGEDRLLALGEAGVGALYVGHVAAPFEHRAESGEHVGRTREMGFYLTPEGSAGTLQELDLRA
jgi:hypothetical protein